MKKIRIAVLFFTLLVLFSKILAADDVKIFQTTSGFQTDFEKNWKKQQGDFVDEKETAAGLPVIAATKPGWLVFISNERLKVPVEMRGFVRLKTDKNKSAYAYFQLGKKDASDQGITLSLGITDNPTYPERVGCSVRNSGKFLHDNNELAKNMDWTPVFSNDFTYILKAYPKILPGWPEDYRVQIENDMSGLPDHNSKWIEIRVVLRENSVWAWVDDRLIAYKRDENLQKEGFAGIMISQGVQLAGLTITKPEEETPDFYPVRINGYANGRFITGNTFLKPFKEAGKITYISGIPFILPSVNIEGNDHLDISKSLFREGNLEGYFPVYNHAFAGCSKRDPARIQLRIPFDTYNCLYVLAASDGRPNSV
ncbi:MAG: hypothetical protein N2115_03580, partial [bacterium]|nr:hypothetical protein [bacterium]